MSAVDAETMRRTLGHYASGLTVITASSPAGPLGFTCQAFSSLSLTPALITFAPSRSSTTWPAIRSRGAFCINILAADQAGLANAFARSGADKYAEVTWRDSAYGSPVLAGVLAHIDCRLWAEYDGGDHTIVAAEVLDFSVDDLRAPLLYYKGAYRTELQGAS